MRNIFYLFLCLACVACGRRIGAATSMSSLVSSDGTVDPSRSLANLLLAVNPSATPLRTFKSALTGSSPMLLEQNHLGYRASKTRMLDAAAATPDMTPIKSEETYNMMLNALLGTNKSIETEVSANWAMMDMRFLNKLGEEMEKGNAENSDRLKEIQSVINKEMAKRVQGAAEVLKELISSPTSVVMEGRIAGLARQGRIDQALLELVQVNLQQAQQAADSGNAQAKNAVIALKSMLQRVQDETDKKMPPATALLRQLLRMDSADARQTLLRKRMKPKEATTIVLAGISKEEEEAMKDTKPDVPPRELAQAITEIKARFGNVNEEYDTGFVTRLEKVAEEAEAVALDLAGGKEITSKQAQDLAWEQKTVSVWDLGALEDEAHQDGNFAVWEEEAQQQMARQESAQRSASVQRDFGQ